MSYCYSNPGALSCRLAEHIASPSFTDLSDLVRRQTGSAAYLDSNDLVDLRTLFNEGDLHTFSHTPTRAHTDAQYARLFMSECALTRFHPWQVFTSRTLLLSSQRKAS